MPYCLPLTQFGCLVDVVSGGSAIDQLKKIVQKIKAANAMQTQRVLAQTFKAGRVCRACEAVLNAPGKFAFDSESLWQKHTSTVLHFHCSSEFCNRCVILVLVGCAVGRHI